MLHDLYGFLKKPAYRQKKTFNGEKAPSVYRFCS